MTSSLQAFGVEYWEGGFSLFIPLNPVPASRPRVTRWGVYYGKNYATWMKQAEKVITESSTTLSGPLSVATELCVKKPKTSKRSFPRGDLDNYEKAIWDAITKKKYWVDDDQIIESYSSKSFTDGDGYIKIQASEVII